MTITSISTKRAVGYLRVSTPGQAGERHSSLEAQEARFREYCERLDLIPVSTYVDVVSGRRDDRQEYLRLVRFVLQGGADVVVVQFLDRFGRNPREILQRYWELQDHGVQVTATDEDIREELLLLIKAGMAGAESRRTSERVRANMGRAVQKGVHAARAPYGLRRLYEGREVRWEIDSIEAPVVREMYRLAVDENFGYKVIADRLNAAGHRSKWGRPFASYTVQRILSNEALMGTLAYGKRPRKGNPQEEVIRVAGFFPAILSAEEWERLQQRIAIRRESPRGKAHSSTYLLGGIARCGNCGGPMSGKTGAMWRGRRYRNYYCSRAMSSRERCATYNGHSARKLEKAVLEYLGQFSDLERVREHLATAERREVAEKEAYLKVVDKGLSDIETQFMQHLDLLKRDILTEDEFIKANEALRGQKSALDGRKADLEAWLEQQNNRESAAARMPSAINSFVEDFGALEVRIQKARLQEILKAVHVHRDVIEVEFRV
jgi:site-specific DNA recombinase